MSLSFFLVNYSSREPVSELGVRTSKRSTCVFGVDSEHLRLADVTAVDQEPLAVHRAALRPPQPQRMPSTILITDAAGLVGSFLIQNFLSRPSFQADHPPFYIRAGYQTPTQLRASREANKHPEIIHPVLVDFSSEVSFPALLDGVTRLYLLTPFTSSKAALVRAWTAAATTAGVAHIINVGVHCASDGPGFCARHEQWQLAAEQEVVHGAANTGTAWTLLRINFDGYNGVLRPGKQVAYFLPRREKFGWIAREDIAAVSAEILLGDVERHAGQTYVLSTEALSLEDMAAVATEVCGGAVVEARTLTGREFAELALSVAAVEAAGEGYVPYMESVREFFETLNGEGADKEDVAARFRAVHSEVYPEVVRGICGREFLSFKNWLAASPLKARLMQPP